MLEKKTLNACVIGFPIHHSKSPILHNYWVKHYGLEAHYAAESIEPVQLQDFLSSVKLGRSDYEGGNATIPHKESLLALSDWADETATTLGAANTFWVEGGDLCVTNTDVYGFLANLDEGARNWDGAKNSADKKAVVLGAGGAARAVIFGLIDRGFQTIILANRTLSRAETLADHFSELAEKHRSKIIPTTFSLAEQELAAASLLVNTTSLGMVGQPDLEFSIESLPLNAVVTDIVYTPLKTGLLNAAEARGLKIVDGLGMLLHQAVPGFEKWFGVRPEVTEALRLHILDENQTGS